MDLHSNLKTVASHSFSRHRRQSSSLSLKWQNPLQPPPEGSQLEPSYVHLTAPTPQTLPKGNLTTPLYPNATVANGTNFNSTSTSASSNNGTADGKKGPIAGIAVAGNLISNLSGQQNSSSALSSILGTPDSISGQGNSTGVGGGSSQKPDNLPQPGVPIVPALLGFSNIPPPPPLVETTQKPKVAEDRKTLWQNIGGASSGSTSSQSSASASAASAAPSAHNNSMAAVTCAGEIKSIFVYFSGTYLIVYILEAKEFIAESI
ncbi:hypothetical protein CROQUDRAFT_98826 [Cronartium quercuum f. sp. fusiforme G11]|uniref:Uncharacterized protein n=1 Tax=Cronartium quercuum f. sp. fusiforme G11 TaxID=708437 RepID=A0A9P6N7L5_9BASI|nr:hypothetical protein CROQUDRAFT_98826 [Cronartium quercuum f. sp. fusiforme G11]